MKTFEVESCIQGYHVFKSIWNPTTGEELNCVWEKTNTKDPYAIAVICRRAVVGHVPRKMSACALFLRRNHLRLVLFNTRIQSCHEKFDRLVCIMYVWAVHIKLISCLLLARIYIWREFKFGNVLMIHQAAKLKSPPNFPTIWYILHYFLPCSYQMCHKLSIKIIA